MYFSGNGGGRVFNYQDEKNVNGASSSNSLNHRKIKVSGTSQQLTFYGLNLERGGAFTIQSAFPMIEMVNSSNIEIFSAKSEAQQPYAQINNCKDIFMTNIIDYAPTGQGKTMQNYIEIIGTSDSIEISNALFLYPPSSAYKIVADLWNTNEPDRTMHLGLYQRNLTSFFGKAIPTAINTLPSDQGNWIIFPNPTNSSFYVQSKFNRNPTNQGILYNGSGEKVRTFAINGSEKTKIDLSDSVNGIYFISIQNPEGKMDCFKLIKN
jgi:hypothetical protein